jgi:hypothetical protein
LVQLKVAIELTNILTGTNVAAGYWSGIESNLSIICASLPTLRPLLSRFFPQLMASSANAGSAVQSAGNSRFSEVARRVDADGRIHSLDILSKELEVGPKLVQDVETGKIMAVTVLELESEQGCDTSDGASDRKLVALGLAI